MNWNGKVINFLGDSITEGVGVSDRENNRYDHILKKTCGFSETYNYGISGTNIAKQEGREDSYLERAPMMEHGADIIIVQGGGNDCNHCIPLGELDSTDPYTYCGALRLLIRLIKNDYPESKLIVSDSMRKKKEPQKRTDDLKHSVQNASYEQKDPLLIFKLESVTLFDKMVNKINDQTVSTLMRGQIPVQEREQTNVKVAPDPKQRRPQQRYSETKVDLNDPNQQAAAQHDTRENVKREPVRVEKTVGRNDPCPCGSGKKFKNCHGRNL